MKVSVEEARNIVYDDNEKFEKIEESIESTSRWSIYKTGIFEHLLTNKFYEISWSVGATESQDERPFEYETNDIELYEVEKKEVLVTKWVSVSKKD